MNKTQCIVILPTYNEAENIEPLINGLFALGTGIGVAVVDDGSPDGTAEKARAMAGGGKDITLLSRQGKRGRGLAGREGYLFAIGRGAEFIIEMDADLSHDPKYIPLMLNAIKDCDIVIGSRFAPGGSDERRSLVRSVISSLARTFIFIVLGIKVSDPTSGYRCFRRKALEDIHPETLKSETPSIIVETLYRAVRNGAVIRDIPIKFHPRKEQRSKLSLYVLFDCFFSVLRLRIKGDAR